MNYLKGKVSVLFMMFSMLFCTCLIAANILETKQIDVFGIDLTCGLLVFPVSYIINDCVCEVWGYRKCVRCGATARHGRSSGMVLSSISSLWQ